MTRCADGLATGADLIAAATEAAKQALAGLSGHEPDLACVFVSGGSAADAEQALARAAEVTSATSSIGCTAYGVIGAKRGVEGSSAVSVWAASLPGVRLRSYHLEVMRTPASLAVLGMPRTDSSDGVAILLADPYTFPVDGFVEQSNDALPGLPFAGGLASGAHGSGSTRLMQDGKVYDRGAVGVVIGGPRVARTVVSQGCRPIGPPMTVTAAEGNLLLQLAGSPALRKLEEVVTALPPEDQALATSGLQVGVAMDDYPDDPGQGDFLVRGVVGADPRRGALAIGDVVDVGRTVQFQIRDAEAASADLSGTLGAFRAVGGLDPIDGALLFSCNGRGEALFGSPDHDVLAVTQGLAAPGVAGFFANGEIGQVGGGKHLHGVTASI